MQFFLIKFVEYKIVCIFNPKNFSIGMESTNDIRNDYLVDLMMSTKKDDLNYIYKGEFTQNLSQHILSLAEKNIDRNRISHKIKKRVFHIMVESIQNISRHGDSPVQPEEDAMFSIQKQKEWYYITTGNVIEQEKVEPLRAKLDKINNLDSAELDLFYREVLSNGKLSTKGGAGLGLIEMARKSGNKLSYDLRQINGTTSYFYMHSNINTISLGEAPEPPENSVISLKYMTKLHQYINEHDIVLIYSAVFDQENLLSLISIMKNRGNDTLNFKKKIISLMVEMLQNIIHHGGVEMDEIKGSQGIFYISIKKEKYYLTTINYIKNSSVDILKNKIDHINDLTDETRENFYNERLFDFEINSPTGAGLGLIEMRIKSRNPIYYQFYPLNNEYSLFKLTLCLENK